MVLNDSLQESTSPAATPLEDVCQESSEGVEHGAVDVAGLVAVAQHVLDVALELVCVFHRLDHRVEALKYNFALGVEGGVSGRTVDGDRDEDTELGLGSWELLKDPFDTSEQY